MASTSNNARTLLRAERLSRRISHPHASYTTAGTLSCTICNLRLQADSLWEPHLAGKVHRTNLTKRREHGESLAKEVPIREVELGHTNGTTKKRKAEDDEDVGAAMGKKRKAEEENPNRENTVRKIAKPVSKGVLPEGFFDSSTKTKGAKNVHFQDQDDPVVETEVESIYASPQDRAGKNNSQDIDNEYASFEAALASATTAIAEHNPPQSTHSYTSSASISAAPISAADLAAAKTAEEAQSQGKRGRDEEIEGEKEDAVRALEEEFDEMDALEARVERLKEIRERIRAEASDVPELDEVEEDIGGAEEEGEEDASDDDDDYDDWMMR